MENIIVVTESRLKEILAEVLAAVSPEMPKANSDQPNYLSTVEAAKFIKKSPGALRQIVHKGELTSIKRGNTLLFLQSDLIAWLEQGRRNIDYVDPANYLK